MEILSTRHVISGGQTVATIVKLPVRPRPHPGRGDRCTSGGKGGNSASGTITAFPSRCLVRSLQPVPRRNRSTWKASQASSTPTRHTGQNTTKQENCPSLPERFTDAQLVLYPGPRRRSSQLKCTIRHAEATVAEHRTTHTHEYLNFCTAGELKSTHARDWSVLFAPLRTRQVVRYAHGRHRLITNGEKLKTFMYNARRHPTVHCSATPSPSLPNIARNVSRASSIEGRRSGSASQQHSKRSCKPIGQLGSTGGLSPPIITSR